MGFYQFFLALNAFALVKISATVSDEEYMLMPPLFHLDNFDNCMVLKEKALYCSITVQLAPVDSKNYSDVWSIIQEVISNKKYYRHDQLRHGICVPESCPDIQNASAIFSNNDEPRLRTAISKCYTEKYKNVGLEGTITSMHCETNDPFYSIDTFDIVVGLIFMILISLVIYASIFEGTARYKTKEEYDALTNTTYGKIISCFSVPKNWNRLRSQSTVTEDTSLRCFNGFRFYNMLMVIMAHSCMISNAGPVSNTQFVEKITEQPLNMLLINGGYTIQTFLAMSGWLLSYHFFQTFEGRNNVKFKYILTAFVNRYIRLTPCLLLMIAFSGSWLYHLDRGPLWDKVVGEEYRNCRKNWWTNVLYINNYYDSKHICIQQTWYLAVDTQLFLLSLVITMLMWKHQKHIKAILGTALSIGVLLPGLINYIYNYDALIRHYPEPLYNALLNVEQWHVIWISGYTNIGGYVIGLIFGYIFYTYRSRKIFTKTWRIILWWILTWGLPLSVIFLAFPLYMDEEYARFGSAIYVSLARNIFVLGTCIGLFGITQNVGWFLRDVNIWSPIQVLGRVTYCVYLVHAGIIRARGGQNRTLVYLSNFNFLAQICGDVVLSYVFGTLLCLSVEMPISGLQKHFVPQLQAKRNQAVNIDNKEMMTNNFCNNITKV